jgi:hypothetical protein
MIFEKIDFIDVEEPAIGAGQKTRLESLHAFHQSAFYIERAAHAVFGRAQRQIDHRHYIPPSRQSFFAIEQRGAIRAEV